MRNTANKRSGFGLLRGDVDAEREERGRTD